MLQIATRGFDVHDLAVQCREKIFPVRIAEYIFPTQPGKYQAAVPSYKADEY